MKLARIFFLQLVTVCGFCATPWDIDPKLFNELSDKIEAKRKEHALQEQQLGIPFYIDQCIKHLNFQDTDCLYCQNLDTGQELEAALKKEGFQRFKTRGSTTGHCFGLSILFTKYLLDQPLNLSQSCAQMMADLENQPNYSLNAHAFSINQPAQYFEIITEHIALKPSLLKRFCHTLTGHKPQVCYFLPKASADPSKFNNVAIYTTLQKFPNALIYVAYSNTGHLGHAIVACTHPEKFLVFDVNAGLYQFRDLETLSSVCGRFLQGSTLDYLVVFPLEGV